MSSFIPETQSPGADARLPPPEIYPVQDRYTFCDGGGAINPALGHPRVFLTIPHDRDHVDCSYCDRRFVLAAHSA